MADTAQSERFGGKPPHPARPPGGFILHLSAVFTGVLCGFSTLLLAHKYLSARLLPSPKINYSVFATPNARLFQEVYVPAIEAARREILVAAREISSRKLLEALRAKAAAGVEVEFLLSPDADNRATVRWIKENAAGRVYIDSQPMADQLVVIDDTKVILTSLPFTADAPTRIHARGLAVEDAGLGRQLSRQFLQTTGQVRQP